MPAFLIALEGERKGMNALLSAIGMIFGKLMMFIYNTVGFQNYVISLILFTLVYKLILLPLSVKQIKSSMKMQELQPELQRIQERYKNDKEKLNEMTMKFYQEKGYNPTSGCLPLLIQFPIIIALFYVIRMPMSYMLEIPAKAVGEMVVASVDYGELGNVKLKNNNYEAIKNDPVQVYQAYNSSDYYFEIKLIDSTKKHPDIIDNNTTLTSDQKALLKKFDLRMFGIFNLGQQPSLTPAVIIKDPGTYVPPLILLLLAVITTYFSSLLMMAPNLKKKDPKDKSPNAGCAGKSMLYMSPLMTLWIGAATPSGLAVYWTINSILSYIQQMVMNKMYRKDKEEKQVAKIDSKGSKNSR